MTLTAISLFAGVGGIDLAMQRAGVNVTAAGEIDTAARGVLADRFPETTLFPDVTKVTADDLIPTITARYGKGTDSDVTDAMIVSTLQGGGERGYRIDAESAAGGHLLPADVQNAPGM
jgi:site-specific DNA-cytosine methylase